MSFVLFAGVAWAECVEPTTTDSLEDALVRADLAFAALDASGFEAAVDDARVHLTCLGESLTAPDAAAYHRVEAYAAFFAGDHDRAIGHFAAAGAIQHAWELPSTVAPTGHPLREDFDAARSATTAMVPVSDAKGVAWVQVDGVRADVVPDSRPFVLQRFRVDGAVLDTQLLHDPSAIPSGPEVPDEPASGRRGAAVRWGLVVASAAATGGAVTANLFAHRSETELANPLLTGPELAEVRAETNNWTKTAAALGGIAAGAGFAATLAFVGAF